MERYFDGPIWIWEGAIMGGMSGSPILADDGTAVGVVTAGVVRFDGAPGVSPPNDGVGPQAVILRDLPPRITKQFSVGGAA